MDQYHLRGKHFSGRAVRVEQVDPEADAKCLTDAAKLLGGEATILELKKLQWRMGLKEFIKEISDPCDNPQATKWTKVDVAALGDLSKFFTSKDLQVLEALYRDYHEASPAEVEAIVGKVVPVSEA